MTTMQPIAALGESLSKHLNEDVALARAVRRERVPWESPVVGYLVRLAPSSRITQLNALRAACRAFGVELERVGWTKIDRAQYGALRAFVAAKYAPATANRILAAVRGVLYECVRAETLTRDRYDRVVDHPTIPGSTIMRGRSATDAELRDLVAVARQRTDAAGVRNLALLAALYGGGLRRAEAVSLRLEAWDAAGELVVKGKGNKTRLVPLPPKCAAAVRAWLEIRGRAPGTIFCAVYKLGKISPAASISTTRVYQLLCSLCKRAGVPRLSPHDIRRTYCGDLLDAGVDLRTVQGLMGHEDPSTTARYDRRGPRAARAAVARWETPF